MSPDPSSRSRRGSEREAGIARVAAVVPVFNEEAALGEVLKSLLASSHVDEILVVSDGSTDDTVTIAVEMGVNTIHHKKNRGKGEAMATGVAHTTSPLLVFVDGDILNLSQEMLSRLILPVREGRAAMNVGIRNRGALINSIHRRTGPLLSGVRCLRREIFEHVPPYYLSGYRIETALNWVCRSMGLRLETTTLRQLRHLVKERKRGVLRGAMARLEMFLSVFGAHLTLRLRPPPLEPITLSLPAGELEYVNFQPPFC